MRRVPPDSDGLRLAAEVLARGRLCAFPTETVYGLGARADDGAAVRRIYEAKGRPAENPSIVHVPTAERAFALGESISDAARELAACFWPGPLTLIVRVRPGAVAFEVVAGGDTVAVRVPAHPVAVSLLAQCNFPVAAPSANRSNHVSPTTADHVVASLGSRVDVVVDGGATDVGLESTIVDTTTDPPTVLRPGMIGLAALGAVIPIRAAAARRARVGERVVAPGSYERHYAPDVPLHLVDPGAVAPLVADLGGRRVCLVAHAGALPEEVVPGNGLELEILPADASGYARALYAAMHDAEASGAEAIVVVAPPREPAWVAIWDRLERAASGSTSRS